MKDIEKLCHDVAKIGNSVQKLNTCLTGDPLDINNPGLVIEIRELKTSNNELKMTTKALEKKVDDLINKPSLLKIIFSYLTKTKVTPPGL